MGEFIQITNNIRYSIKSDYSKIAKDNGPHGTNSWIDVKKVFDFELFRRPYLFGLMGRKRWIYIGTFESVGQGIEFCEKKGF